MRGCDNFCTFCVVPYTADASAAATSWASCGKPRPSPFRVQTGDASRPDVNSYRAGSRDFVDAITRVADIRASSACGSRRRTPKTSRISCWAVAGHPKICQAHPPAGSKPAASHSQLMNRTYTRTEYLPLVDRIRHRCPAIVLTTDVIAGSAPRPDAEFAETYDLVRRVEYHSAYIFNTRKRKNTIAARKFAEMSPTPSRSERVRPPGFELSAGIFPQEEPGSDRQVVEVLVEGDGASAPINGGAAPTATSSRCSPRPRTASKNRAASFPSASPTPPVTTNCTPP